MAAEFIFKKETFENDDVMPKMKRQVNISHPPFVELFPEEKQAFSIPIPKLERQTSIRLWSVEEQNEEEFITNGVGSDLCKLAEQEQEQKQKLISDIELLGLLPLPKLERQTNRPPSIVEVEDNELIADRDFYELCLLPEEEVSLQCTMPGCDKLYYYKDSHPCYGDICFDCEMNERRQELIDQEKYPDDIPSYLRYNDDYE